MRISNAGVWTEFSGDDSESDGEGDNTGKASNDVARDRRSNRSRSRSSTQPDETAAGLLPSTPFNRWSNASTNN